MSKINGDKARTAIEQRRRTAQRAKDRARRAEAAITTTSQEVATVHVLVLPFTVN